MELVKVCYGCGQAPHGDPERCAQCGVLGPIRYQNRMKTLPDGTQIKEGPWKHAKHHFDDRVRRYLESEGNYENDLEQGLWRYYHPSGAIYREVEIQHGQWHGLFRQWNRQGQILEERMYEDDIKSGPATEWYDDGVKKCEGSYKASEKNGQWLTYHKTGELLSEATFEGAKRIKVRYFKPNGEEAISAVAALLGNDE